MALTETRKSHAVAVSSGLRERDILSKVQLSVLGDRPALLDIYGFLNRGCARKVAFVKGEAKLYRASGSTAG